MLHPLDDHPVHQVPEPLLRTTVANPNSYDRFFFNGYTAAGDLFFAVAFGIYPGRDVIDGALSVVTGDEQVSTLASGRLSPTRETRVGPIRVEIVEPMRVLRVVVDESHGLAADLTFTARTVALEEPQFRLAQSGGGTHLYTRLTQFGAWSGSLSVDGVPTTLDPATTLGCRDRSWGSRPIGERGLGAPATRLPQFFWLWAPINFDDVCTHFDVIEDEHGRRLHDGAFIVPVNADADGPVIDVEGRIHSTPADHDVDWAPGTRRSRGATITIRPVGDEPAVIELDPLLTFHMGGIGYLRGEFGHGMWMGDDAVRGERIHPAGEEPLAPSSIHVQQLCRARWGERTGMGVFEQLVIGPHHPSGMHELLDGA